MKKKKSKLNVQLTPKQYLKQRARTLPIAECWINSDWDQAKMASILVSRKHKQGNYTTGIFLVDLLTLGVKDTFYHFNKSEEEYQELIDKFNQQNCEKVSYELVHNIIYGAIDYFEELGIMPHPEFHNLQYILEEDTEDIDLIDIEFGNLSASKLSN